MVAKKKTATPAEVAAMMKLVKKAAPAAKPAGKKAHGKNCY